MPGPHLACRTPRPGLPTGSVDPYPTCPAPALAGSSRGTRVDVLPAPRTSRRPALRAVSCAAAAAAKSPSAAGRGAAEADLGAGGVSPASLGLTRRPRPRAPAQQTLALPRQRRWHRLLLGPRLRRRELAATETVTVATRCREQRGHPPLRRPWRACVCFASARGVT